MQISETMQIKPLNDGMATTKAELKDQKDLSGIIKREDKIKPDDINFLSILFGSTKDINLKINLLDSDESKDGEVQKNINNNSGDVKHKTISTDAILNILSIIDPKTDLSINTDESEKNEDDILKIRFGPQLAEEAINDLNGITSDVNDEKEIPVMVSDESAILNESIPNTGVTPDSVLNPEQEKKILEKNGPSQNAVNTDLKSSFAINPDEKNDSSHLLPSEQVLDVIGHGGKKIDGVIGNDEKKILSASKQKEPVKNPGNILFHDQPDEKTDLTRENVIYLSNQKSSEAEKVFENLQKGAQAINLPKNKYIKNNIKVEEYNTGKNELSLSNTKESDPAVNTKGVNSSPKLSHTNIVNQIVNKMAFSLKNGQSKVKMSLKPKSLGHLRLEISSNDHKVDVKIITQSAIVKDMIEHHIQHLRTSLEGHGLEMDKVDVFVSGDSNQYREKGEGYHSFGSGNPDYDETIAADNRSVESLPEPVWPGRMGTGENSVDYFA